MNMLLVFLLLFNTFSFAEGFDEIPDFPRSNQGFYIFNNDMIVLHGESELIKKLGSGSSRLHEINYDQFASFKYKKGERVQVHFFHKEQNREIHRKEFHLPDKARVFVSYDRLYLVVNPNAHLHEYFSTKNIRDEEGFAYLGDGFNFETVPSYKVIPLQDTKMSLKSHSYFKNSRNVKKMDVSGNQILIETRDKDDAISLTTKFKKEHLIIGQVDSLNKDMVFYGWLKGYDAFSIREYRSGRCRKLFFVNEDGVKQIKLPCINQVE